MEPLFFATATDFRNWLKTHHATARELWVGFHKKGSGRPSITWPESVDEALCVGWIDGLRRRIDDESYVIRFTPRKPTSTWSSVNTKRMAELIREGRVRPAGLKAFELRSDEKTALYSCTSKRDVSPVRRGFRAAIPVSGGGLEVFPGPAAVVPQDRHVLGGELPKKKRRGRGGSRS